MKRRDIVTRWASFKNYANIWSTETGIKQIKHLKKGEEFEFTIKTKNPLELINICVSDNEKIQELLDCKDENYYANKEIGKNVLRGEAIFKDNGYLVFSIAYDKCWKIFVDGKETEKEKIADVFLGVKLEKGEHEIEIRAGG